MPQDFIDALTSPTLKNLRERWWDDEFTAFLAETLHPRAGNRILDVGCGPGSAEVSIGRLRVSQIQLYGIDIKVEEVLEAARVAADHNQRAHFAGGDVVHLPFRNEVFDSTYCVAVLQHVREVETAVSELVRVTRPGGRIVAVEPDNSARYWFSSVPAGMKAFRAADRFFAAVSKPGAETTEPMVGPSIPMLLATLGVEVLDVRLFPVSHAQVGVPEEAVWEERRAQVERLIGSAPTPELRALGDDYLRVLDEYATQAQAAGPAFVEIQNTMLFAAVGQKAD
jgi:SAM-dependent methyltransferase